MTYESVKDSSFGSSNLSLNVSDLQGSHKSIYENVPSLFRSRSDQLIDGNNSYMAKSNYYDPNRGNYLNLNFFIYTLKSF